MSKLTLYRSFPPPDSGVVLMHPASTATPREQSMEGRRLAMEALNNNHQIVYSHSDHLLNGIRIIARLSPGYKEGDFVVVYNDETIKIGEAAQLEHWPEGMSDQSAQDMRILITGKAGSIKC